MLKFNGTVNFGVCQGILKDSVFEQNESIVKINLKIKDERVNPKTGRKPTYVLNFIASGEVAKRMKNECTMMCRSQGIPCYSVDGYKKDDENSLHTWNRVYYDGNWWNCDVTFDSIRLKANKSLYGFLRLGNSVRAPDENYVVTRIY